MLQLVGPVAGQSASGDWKPLSPIPDPEGFAGAFAGTSNGALLVAGGANFPGKRPWEGGAKRFYDTIYVLEATDGAWKVAGKLPHPTAYGVSIDVDRGMLCIGGNGDKQNFADVFLLEWINGEIKKTYWPSLPQAITMAAGARLGSTIFLVCGNVKDAAGKDVATTSLWSLNLNDPKAGWTKREPLPGPPRAQEVVAVHGGALFVISGIGTTAGADGKSKIDYMSDAYRYVPSGATGQWTRLADLPHPNAAAPSPAPSIGKNGILLLGEGAQGKHLEIPMKDRPKLSGDSLVYDVVANSWHATDTVPFGAVCAPVVNWNGRWVVVNGEVRGGVRTPEVWIGTIPE
jgi:N-acetylneuraminic acid mutarotase